MSTVKGINHELTAKLEAEILPLLTPYGRSNWNDLKFKGWRMFVVNQRRGRCFYGRRIVTVPVWTFTGTQYDNGYRAWYLGHEIAHALAGGRANHGPLFMEQLKLVVPSSWTHHEYGYKPRNAAAAGIPQADGTIPQKAPPAARKASLHPQSAINAKNLHLRVTLGVTLKYVRDRKCWSLQNSFNHFAWVGSDWFASQSAVDLEVWARKVIESKAH